MNDIGSALVTVIGSVISLAIISVLVGTKSQTSAVLQAGGSALANVINAAVSPAAGGSGNLGLSSFSTPGLTSL